MLSAAVPGGGTISLGLRGGTPVVEVRVPRWRWDGPEDEGLLSATKRMETLLADGSIPLPELVCRFREQTGLPSRPGSTAVALAGALLPLLDPLFAEGVCLPPLNGVPRYIHDVLSARSPRNAADLLCGGRGTRRVARAIALSLVGHPQEPLPAALRPLGLGAIAARAGSPPDHVADVVAAGRLAGAPMTHAEAMALARALAPLPDRNRRDILIDAATSEGSWRTMEEVAELCRGLRIRGLPRHITTVGRLEVAVGRLWGQQRGDVELLIDDQIDQLDGREPTGGLFLQVPRRVADLVSLGQVLDNCLATYPHRYAQGDNRVLAVRRADGSVAGALEVSPRTGRAAPLLGHRNSVNEQEDVAVRRWIARLATEPGERATTLAEEIRSLTSWGCIREDAPEDAVHELSGADLTRYDRLAAEHDVDPLDWPWAVATLRWAASDPRVPTLPDRHLDRPLRVEQLMSARVCDPRTCTPRALATLESVLLRFAWLDLDGPAEARTRAIALGLTVAVGRD